MVETFCLPSLHSDMLEHIRDSNNCADGMSTKLKANSIMVPDEFLAQLYMKGARLPPGRTVSAFNGVGYQFDRVKSQA